MRRMWIAVLAIALTTTMVALAQKTPDSAALKQAEDNAAAAKAAAEKARVAAEKALDPKQLAADINKALEEILTKALQNSPDVQVAEARMKEAEALLRQARLQVTQKTVELKQTIDQKQQALLSLENQYQLLLKARSQGSVSGQEISKVESDLAAQKAQVAQIESQLNMATGRSPLVLDLYRVQAPLELQMMDRRWRGIPENAGGGLGGGGAGVGEMHSKRHPPQATADRLRKMLNTPFKVTDKRITVPVTDLLADVRQTTGAPILTKGIGEGEAARLEFNGEIALGAYFQMLCDLVPNLQIYVRDYGFLATTESPPDDAMPFMDFWHNVGGA